MKYYIITSSLNIDNILSSESISPISFYGKREFGYRTFQKIDKVNIVNSIILFSEIPFFEIHDSERENYPMVIEIEDDVQVKDKINNVGQNHTGCKIFFYNQTIYLNPWNCRILFFSQQGLIFSKLKCSDSLCNKMSDFYRFELITSNKSFLLQNILESITIKEPAFNIDLLVIDNKLNRLKGFLYGYYLGFSKSLSNDVAKLLGLQKRIYNIVASIINNKGESNDHFNEELKKLESQYNEVDPHKKILRNLWNDKVLSRFTSLEDKNTFDTILKELFVETEAKLNFCKKNNIVVRKLSFSASQKYFDWSAYQSELISYTQSIIHKDKAQKTDIDLAKEFIIPEDYSTIIFKNDYSKLYNEILSGFFFKERVITIEDLRLNKLEIATDFTKGLKTLMQSANKDWDNSSERLFFNSLRQNIANSDPFNLQNAPDIINLSIAAFLLKGEDFEALIRYLEENGVSDYKYVLGFWGAACGYVDMPKPTLNSIIKQKENFCHTYKSINSILFKSHIEGSFPEISNEFLNRTNAEVSIIKENISENKYNEILSEVQKKLGKKINEKQKTTIIKAFESESVPDKILNYLKKNGIKSTTNIYKEIETYFSLNNKMGLTTLPNKKTESQGSIDFNGFTESNLAFIFDEKAYLLVKEMKIDTDIEKKIVANLKNIQSGYRPGGFYEQRGDSKDLKNIIDHFVKYCFSEKNKYNRIDYSDKNRSVLDAIQLKLFSKYNER